MADRTGKQVHLAARPVGEPTQDDFEIVEVEAPEPGDGQVLIRNRFMSVDPYMRGRMNDAKSYVPPFEIGKVMDGGAVGEVIASNAEGIAEGDVVLHGLGWRELAVSDAKRVQKIAANDALPLSAYLGVLGMPGHTAYVGLLDIAGMQEGDDVFVSGAAGAVGSLVGQIARLRGAGRVIGSAGSDEKVAYLRDELGFDAAFNYKSGRPSKLLREAAPDGIDVYFDNVGGDHLEAAIGSLRVNGRVAMCGAISRYNDTEAAPGPRNMSMCVGKRLTLRGFIVSDHNDRLADMQREVGGWLEAGDITFAETVVEGIDQAPGAFIGLLNGANTGKMVVSL